MLAQYTARASWIAASDASQPLSDARCVAAKAIEARTSSEQTNRISDKAWTF